MTLSRPLLVAMARPSGDHWGSMISWSDFESAFSPRPSRSTAQIW